MISSQRIIWNYTMKIIINNYLLMTIIEENLGNHRNNDVKYCDWPGLSGFTTLIDLFDKWSLNFVCFKGEITTTLGEVSAIACFESLAISVSARLESSLSLQKERKKEKKKKGDNPRILNKRRLHPKKK